MGADGFRLDAVPYLMEDGGKLAGSPGTHALLHEYAAYVHHLRRDAFTVGEVYDSIGAVLPYYPDQLDSHFAFEVADAIIGDVREGTAKRLLPPVLRLQRALPADRWAPFLRNHDQPRTMTELRGDVARVRLASFLLLTLPGVPFVYYGEEIGMTGTKPDERIRTPMQWRPVPGGGFTTGRPWEALQPDSLTANVEVEDADSTSLLNLYRRLIHLRARDSALAVGELVPLDAGNDAVAAYLRRAGGRALLVVANVGTTPLSGVALSSRGRVLAPGRYLPRNPLGGPVAATLRTGSNGRIRAYVPLRSLAPMTGYLFELSPALLMRRMRRMPGWDNASESVGDVDRDRRERRE
jgi:glycosidase